MRSAFQDIKSRFPSLNLETNLDYQNWLKAIFNSARGNAPGKVMPPPPFVRSANIVMGDTAVSNETGRFII
jgi:hypothetical protein